MSKYLIKATNDPFGELMEFGYESDPESAINRWCRCSEKWPTCVSLCPEAEEDGIKLLVWARDHFETVRHWMQEHHVPYKPDWMREMIVAAVEKGRTSMQWEYDELFPFCQG